MSDPRRLLGRKAECLVAAWLTESGWIVLARNWRCPDGEIDLVCRDPQDTLVGVEVKCRMSGRAGSAMESVDRRRIGRLRRALARYASASTGRREGGLRIDLVSVTPGSEHDWRLQRHGGVDAW
jgi:putative endonuclease